MEKNRGFPIDLAAPLLAGHRRRVEFLGEVGESLIWKTVRSKSTSFEAAAGLLRPLVRVADDEEEMPTKQA